MRTYEITPPEFDGSTDETDHLIIWISIPDDCEMSVEEGSDLEAHQIDASPLIPGGVDLVVRRK